jgi:hypothetical protein
MKTMPYFANHSKNIFFAIIGILIFVTCSCSWQKDSSEPKVNVLVARKNFVLEGQIEPENLIEVFVEKDKVPSRLVKTKSEARCLPPYCLGVGQVVVPYAFPIGRHEGLTVECTGFQPQTELINESQFPQGRTGVLDLKGNWIVPPIYNEVHHAPQADAFWITNLRHKLPYFMRIFWQMNLKHSVYSDIWQQVDRNGKMTTATLPMSITFVKWPYHGPNYESRNLIVNTNSGVGICDENGHQILNNIFDFIECEQQKYFVTARRINKLPVKQFGSIEYHDKEWKVLDSDCRLICELPKDTDNVTVLPENLLMCSFPSKDSPGDFTSGILDFNGKFVVKPTNSIDGRPSEGLIPWRDPKRDPKHLNLCGYADLNSKIVIAPKYSCCNSFENGVAIVSQSIGTPARAIDLVIKQGCIDKSGKVVLPIRYDYVGRLNDGSFSAFMGNKSYYFDKNLNLKLTLDSKSRVTQFVDGNFVVSISDQYKTYDQFLDSNGKKIGPRFQSIETFVGGKAVATDLHNQYGLVDKSGKWMIEPKFAKLELCGADRLIAEMPVDTK